MSKRSPFRVVKKIVENYCLTCGKPCKGEEWIYKNPDTGMRGTHWRCEEGHCNKKRKYIVKEMLK